MASLAGDRAVSGACAPGCGGATPVNHSARIEFQTAIGGKEGQHLATGRLALCKKRIRLT